MKSVITNKCQNNILNGKKCTQYFFTKGFKAHSEGKKHKCMLHNRV